VARIRGALGAATPMARELARTGVSHARNWKSPLVGKKKSKEEVKDMFLNLGSYSARRKWYGKTNQRGR